MERAFPATIDAIAQLVELIGEEAEAARLPKQHAQRLQVAVEEAAVNISSHAYGAAPGEIRVRTRVANDQFAIDLEDDGPPFDPLTAEAPDVTLDLDRRERGGLGVMLIRRFTDEIRYRRDGSHNVLTLVVNR